MWNKPTKEDLALLPAFYATENVPPKEKVIYMHFFIGCCDWYAAEYDPGSKSFFGFAILNDDLEMAEWGYFSLEELDGIKVQFLEIDRDLHFIPKKAIEVELIRKAQGWQKGENRECKSCA